VFAAALLWKKLPVNSTDPKSLETAKQDIAHIKNKILTFTSEPKPLLQRDEIYIAHMFSTDGAQASADNAKFRYFIPKEGAILWTDNFAIPTSSHQVDEAYRFIDFFLEPEHALELALNNHVATTNKTARARLPKSATDNPNFYPQKELLDRLQMMDDLGSELSKLNQMWTELKSY
ncbi:MAG: extracellular solute-binding protein, partial [Deltaproteobacteria bacterium]|nr:extracellular solute-binding protein [Deltaproteobacteria bacterium]